MLTAPLWKIKFWKKLELLYQGWNMMVFSCITQKATVFNFRPYLFLLRFTKNLVSTVGSQNKSSTPENWVMNWEDLFQDSQLQKKISLETRDITLTLFPSPVWFSKWVCLVRWKTLRGENIFLLFGTMSPWPIVVKIRVWKFIRFREHWIRYLVRDSISDWNRQKTHRYNVCFTGTSRVWTVLCCY